jgi:ATP-dependent Clp protease ATP-binding subunit ClpA
MFNRFSAPARAAVEAAADEAQRRGDARVGTEHLLLGVLHEADSAAVRTMGVDLAAARAALRDMDIAALAAVGLDLDAGFEALPVELGRAGGHRPFTAAAKATIARTLAEAQRRRDRRLGTTHLVLALLDCGPQDPVSQLFARLGVDTAVVRSRLTEAS